MATTLRQRLLQDIAELQTKPYPNISLHVQDEDITKACLVLNAKGYGPMHLTMEFCHDYPLSPPKVRMDSYIFHPNIFGTYICASILNTTEGYTPAYTLKGIAIQLLSFFSSDKIEQSGGGYFRDLGKYRNTQSYLIKPSHLCNKCRFGIQGTSTVSSGAMNLTASPRAAYLPLSSGPDVETQWPTPQLSASLAKGSTSPGSSQSKSTKPFQNLAHIPESVLRKFSRGTKSKEVAHAQALSLTNSRPKVTKGIANAAFPDEILLLICEKLDTEDLMVFAEAWSKIGKIITTYDVIRTRELQCFCLKKDYMATKLGVGVSVDRGAFQSEFDLLSQEGFETHRIRRSVQGVSFQHWLPLPISQGHWRKVKDETFGYLNILSRAGKIEQPEWEKVIYHFMNDIVVKLNQQTSIHEPYYIHEETAKSTLTHASEKAIESYFHLFHLLLCLATAQPSIVASANGMLRRFLHGETSKASCPNLGHLLVAALISDVEMTETVIKAIIKETVTRNVVWMLDQKGSDMADLAYLEPSAVSLYRCKKTFEAGKTSYRLLMFLSLFQRTAVGSPRKPLTQLRDEAFERHGAPPRGAAKGLAESIKRIHQVETFPDFLLAMCVRNIPTAASFTTFLRGCVEDSVRKGYSKMPLTQGEALTLRMKKEPGVEVASGVYPEHVNMLGKTFFPGTGGRFGGRRGRGRR
jgi:ubiquitin-protein ligase